MLACLLLAPLLGGVFLALLGRCIPRRWVLLVSCGSVWFSFVVAVFAFRVGAWESQTFTLFQWFSAGNFIAVMDVHFDPLSAAMALMVTFVSGLIHIYSTGYMRHDEDFVRFFCYLNFFVFFMLVITLADNLVFLFLGWEGVGFCSYALIGFWYRNPANGAAGRKAFLLTRVGDVAFGVAIGLFFVRFGHLSMSFINAHALILPVGAATLLGLLLLFSAVGKSAQLPLVIWLPDAMAGPTPVSALIHAATMVTAGVYLLMRFFPVVSISPVAMQAIALVGAVSAFYAACSALAQCEIKRVLAYSTISQLGYMFLGVGGGDLVGGMALLLAHAFYKALLFLGAGVIIQALHEENDITHMGRRVRQRVPVVFWLFLAGVTALAALPPTSGFICKDRILVGLFNRTEPIYRLLWAMGSVTAFLTTLYSFRLFFLTFTGEPVDSHGGQAGEPQHEPASETWSVPRSMSWVLWPLTILGLSAGLMNMPTVWGGSERLGHFLGSVPGAVASLEIPHGTEWMIGLVDTLLAASGVMAAAFFYGPRGVLRRQPKTVFEKRMHEILVSGFYLDRIYHALIARPYSAMARVLWVHVDEGRLDRGLVQAAGSFVALSGLIRTWTSGRLTLYLRMMLLGFTAALTILAVILYRSL